ncbi:MAG: glycosyltransferase, partial [Gammaproteobacteria bacterium]|nr:glycosyltransferase [Gammaproteobacteria bacterium]
MLIARLGCFGPDGAALCNPPLERRLELQGERQCLRFELGAAGPIASLELHPGVGEGFFHLYRLAVGDSRGVHWERDPFMPGELDGLQLSGMVHGQSVIGEVFSVLETDASLRIPLPVTELGTGAWVEVELDCARGADFLIARDNFLREHARLREQVQTQAERILELEVDARELAMVRRSRVWRAAEFLRRLIYLKLLSVVPSLQRRLLSATRGEPVPDAVLTPARKAPTVEELRAREHAAYAAWCARHDRDQSALREAKRSIASFARKPLISIIMPVYNMEPQWLERAIDSVKAQIYDNWELCVVDDSSRSESTLRFLARLRHPRMKIRFLKKNLNIAGATNEAIDMASGEYLGFMDNDDELAPDALFEIARAINDLDPDLMYSDEDFIDTDGKRVNPHFKPDFSPDLLLSHNYITHFCVLRRSLFDAAGPLQTQYDGAQDYALMLRATELTRKIHHIPRILYHWRMGEWSTSQDADAKPEAPGAARRALEDTLKRRGIAADILPGNSPHFFRVRRHIVGEPLVSIIIPFRDKPELLRVCVDSILQKSTWKNFEIVGVSNASEAPETF